MPTASGPFSFSTRFHCAAIVVEGLVPGDRLELAVLGERPFRMRMSGRVSRSART